MSVPVVLGAGVGAALGFNLFGPLAAQEYVEGQSEINSPKVERNRTTRGKLQAKALMDQMRQEAKLNQLLLKDEEL